MKCYHTLIGGHKAFVSRDDGCATDVGDPPCDEPVVALVFGPGNPDAIGVGPYFAITPKCQEHLEELGDPETEGFGVWKVETAGQV